MINCYHYHSGGVLVAGFRLTPAQEDPSRRVLKLGYVPNVESPENLAGLPREAEIPLHFTEPPETVAQDGDENKRRVEKAYFYPKRCPATPTTEPFWNARNSYAKGVKVQARRRLYMACDHVPVGTPLERPLWEEQSEVTYFIKRLKEETSIKYVHLDTYVGEFADPGIILPGHTLGNCVPIVTVRTSRDKAGSTGYADEYLLTMQPGSAVLFTCEDGARRALAYPIDIRTCDIERATHGLMAFESWEDLRVWIEGNPYWNRKVPMIAPIKTGVAPELNAAPREKNRPKGKTFGECASTAEFFAQLPPPKKAQGKTLLDCGSTEAFFAQFKTCADGAPDDGDENGDES